MKAVIMAGGEGTRLRPLTANQPKPMLPMANRPMMEHILALLRRHGFEDVVVTVAFLANAIRTYFGDGGEFGVNIAYATEASPMGTAGSVRNARDELTERFLVISGDVLTDFDLSSLLRFHEQRGAIATIGLAAMENPLDFGIVVTEEDGTVQRFLEKPGWGQVFSDTVNTGIYVLEPEIFDFIPEDRPVDFASDVFPAVLGKGLPIYGFVSSGYWEDVGTLSSYLRAHQDILDRRVLVNIAGFEMKPGVWVAEGALVEPSARVDGPSLIGPNSRVGAGAHIGEYCVIGANTHVGAGTKLQRTVAHDNVYLSAGVQCRGTILGRSAELRQGVRCEEGVVLGDECFIGAHAILNGDVRVYPFKTVETGAIINSSIIWESRGARTLFGRDGVAGLANVDMTPELAVRLSMAWASMLPMGSTVAVSRDSSRSARVLKRAIMVGCNAAGVNVDDLEVATVPMTRYQVRLMGRRGGMTVRLVPDDRDSVVLRFFDESGIDVDETTQRKIERLYYREEFRRSLAGELGEIGFPARTVELYAADLVDSVDLVSIRRRKYKIVLDYAFGTASFVMPNVLAKLGAEVLVVNPYAATASALSFDHSLHAGRVAELVQASRADLGAVINPDAEHCTLVDDTGHVLDDGEALLALLTLVVRCYERAAVALPVSLPRAAEAICAAHGASISLTKLSAADLMQVALGRSTPGDDGAPDGESSGRDMASPLARSVPERVIDFAGSQLGGFIFPQFLPAYDAAATLVHLMDLLAKVGEPLSAIVGGLPPVFVAHEEVVTPWERKGMLMRQLVEQAKGRDVVLVDGVKFLEPDGWLLVIPDPEEPLTHIWAEGPTDPSARSRAHEQAVRLAEMLR